MLEIEFAKPEYIEDLSKLIVSATRELRGIDFNEEGWNHFISSNTPIELERKLSNPEFLIACCIESNKILGFISIKDREKIDQLFVLPEVRRKGVATFLWSFSRNKAVENGASGNFWVRSSSVAVPVYEKFGFKSEGQRQVFNGIAFQLMRLQILPLL